MDEIATPHGRLRTIESTLESLPDEILHCILDLAAPESLARVRQTSRRLKSIADEADLWRNKCQAHYRFWASPRHVASDFNLPAKAVNWQLRFKSRRISDIATLRALRGILVSQRGRITRMKRIGAELMDAKDVLLSQIDCDSREEDVLARRWWAKAALEFLQRKVALNEWRRLVQAGSDEEVSLERALVAFDLFTLGVRSGGFEETERALDGLAEELVMETPEFNQFSTRKKALHLLDYMRRKGFTGIDNVHRNYHDMPNNFFGHAVLDPHHQTLPLILVCIYSCVGKRLGLEIHVTNIPMHCYGIVCAPPNVSLDGQPLEPNARPQSMFIDPFRHAAEVPFQDIAQHLLNLGIESSSHQEYLTLASVHDIILRVTRNIITSRQTEPPPEFDTSWTDHAINQQDAFCAALWAMLIVFSPDEDEQPVVAAATFAARRSRVMPWLLQEISSRLPWDVSLLEDFILDTYVPWYGTRAGRQLFEADPTMGDSSHVDTVEEDQRQLQRFINDIRRYDETPRPKKLRSMGAPFLSEGEEGMENDGTRAMLVNPYGLEHPDDKFKFKYKVGSVIWHRRYGYQGIIVGWDTTCRKSDAWISQMGVDSLPCGRQQSFYDVVATDTSRRYVAHENISATHGPPNPALMLQAGQWFKRWDELSGRFVSNIKDEYPDD